MYEKKSDTWKKSVKGNNFMGKEKFSYNGRVCTDKRNGWPCWSQMITFTEKLTNLKYELPMAYLDRDIRILRHL